eukprot:scaffold23723_cov88-Phaeocystis_antarctica.AAC.1
MVRAARRPARRRTRRYRCSTGGRLGRAQVTHRSRCATGFRHRPQSRPPPTPRPPPGAVRAMSPPSRRPTGSPAQGGSAAASAESGPASGGD